MKAWAQRERERIVMDEFLGECQACGEFVGLKGVLHHINHDGDKPYRRGSKTQVLDYRRDPNSITYLCRKHHRELHVLTRNIEVLTCPE